MVGPEELHVRDEDLPNGSRSDAVEPVGAHREHPTEGNPHATWTFMTNHAHVLFCLAEDPTVRLREVAGRVGITERAVQRIVADLQDGGYIQVRKEGRRNRYEVNRGLPLRHDVERHRTVSELLELICRH